MLSLQAVLILGAGLSLVRSGVAQSLSDLPACGQTCINNLLAEGPQLGCPDSSAQCLCSNVNFGYGIRDCSNQACPSETDTQSIIAFGLQYCAAAANSTASLVATNVFASTTFTEFVTTVTATLPTGGSLFTTTYDYTYIVTGSEQYASLFSSTSTAPSRTSAAPAASSTSSGGLSTGAKAGIGVGVGVGGLLILLAIAFILFRSRRRRQKKAAAATADEPHGKPELRGSPLPRTHGREELDEGRPRAELDATEPLTKPPTELAGSNVPELTALEKSAASAKSEEQSQATRVASSSKEIHETDKAKVE